MPETQPAQLFSFGTLTQPQVQHALFGGHVPSQPAGLPGHGLVYVPITDPDVIRLSGAAEHRGLARRVEEAVQGHVEFVMESGVVSIIATCQRVVELHGIRCREWGRRAALVVTCQRVWIHRLKLGWDA